MTRLFRERALGSIRQSLEIGEHWSNAEKFSQFPLVDNCIHYVSEPHFFASSDHFPKPSFSITQPRSQFSSQTYPGSLSSAQPSAPAQRVLSYSHAHTFSQSLPRRFLMWNWIVPFSSSSMNPEPSSMFPWTRFWAPIFSPSFFFFFLSFQWDRTNRPPSTDFALPAAHLPYAMVAARSGHFTPVA